MFKKELLPLCTNQLQKDILDYLCKTSSKKRVTRDTLVSELHKKDKDIREEILSMRRQGMPIASSMDTPGYYIPKDYKEYQEFQKRYLGRANTIYLVEKKMRDNAFNLYHGQGVLDVNGK